MCQRGEELSVKLWWSRNGPVRQEICACHVHPQDTQAGVMVFRSYEVVKYVPVGVDRQIRTTSRSRDVLVTGTSP